MESIQWRPASLVQKWDRDQVAWVRGKTGLLEPNCDTLLEYVKPYEETPYTGNMLLTAGLDRITKILTGASTATWTQNTCRLGVGDLATAEAAGNTTLASTSQYFRTQDAGFPTQANGVLTFKASFVDAEANFAWACWGIDAGTTNTNAVVAPLINRKVQSMGTKTSGTWALTVTITLA